MIPHLGGSHMPSSSGAGALEPGAPSTEPSRCSSWGAGAPEHVLPRDAAAESSPCSLQRETPRAATKTRPGHQDGAGKAARYGRRADGPRVTGGCGLQRRKKRFSSHCKSKLPFPPVFFFKSESQNSPRKKTKLTSNPPPGHGALWTVSPSRLLLGNRPVLACSDAVKAHFFFLVF